MSEVIVTDDNFEEEVIQSQLPVLVDFWAAWCGPCRAIAPVVKNLAEKYSGKLKVAKMNVDENPQTPGKYGIMSIPTLILFKQGKEVERIIGYHAQPELESKIDKVL